MSNICKCSTCGYKWERGKTGDHFCSDYLLITIEKQKKAIDRLFHEFGNFCKSINDVQNHIGNNVSCRIDGCMEDAADNRYGHLCLKHAGVAFENEED